MTNYKDEFGINELSPLALVVLVNNNTKNLPTETVRDEVIPFDTEVIDSVRKTPHPTVIRIETADNETTIEFVSTVEHRRFGIMYDASEISSTLTITHKKDSLSVSHGKWVGAEGSLLYRDWVYV